MNILVTGAAGFIGMHVCERLLARGDAVVGLEPQRLLRPVPQARSAGALTPHDTFRFIEMDVANRDGMATLFAAHHFDCVVHLAAQAGVRYSIDNPHVYIDSNLVGFTNILEGCRHSRAEKNFLPMQDGDVPGTHADVSALTAWTGVSPSTPVREGVQRFVDWYRAYYP